VRKFKNRMNLEEKIERLIKEEVENLGYQLRKVEIKQKGRAKELIITIDKEGGVSVEDCARVSRKIDPILEKEDLFERRWYLTVSSPGTEVTEEDLKRLKSFR
jgi:ribosome maturation factor RimP